MITRWLIRRRVPPVIPPRLFVEFDYAINEKNLSNGIFLFEWHDSKSQISSTILFIEKLLQFWEHIWIFWEHYYYYYYYKYWYFKNVIVISHFIIEDISMRIQNQSEFSKTKGKQTEYEFSLLRKDNATRCIIFGARDGFCGLWNWQQMTVSHEVWDSMINEKYASVIM